MTAHCPYVHVTQPGNMASHHELIWAVFAAMLLALLAGCGHSGGQAPAPAPNMYSVSASVSGLSGTGLVLQFSDGSTLQVAANGYATFETLVASGEGYQVSVQSQPSSPQQVCSVANGSGTIGAGNVTVSVTCLTVSYSVGVSVSGLAGSGLVLALNAGNNLAISANGDVTFSTPVLSGTNYQVTVATQPASPQQVCLVVNGSGTVGAGNVAVAVTCVNPGSSYTVGVTVQGLSGSGLVLQLNGASNLPITANGQAVFAAPMTTGTPYTVSVQTQPTSPAQTCVLSRASGTIINYNVNTALISCITILSASGAPTVSTLYSFGTVANYDGSGPTGILIQARDQNLYGTTSNGGTANLGTVFRVTLGGNETVLHSFDPNNGDDPTTQPHSGDGFIQASDGNFYGVNSGNDFGGQYGGYVFELSPAGAESKIFDEIQLDVGDVPLQGGIIESSDGWLYGNILGNADTIFYSPIEAGITTPAPLANTTLPFGYQYGPILQAGDGSFYITLTFLGNYGGIVKIGAGGAATPFYSFGTTPGDGKGPQGLIQGTDGNLYGTTGSGGSPSAACPNGCGTVFKMTPAGAETVLYSFGSNAADGQAPSGALVQGIDGNFYGLTSAGGSTPTGSSATPNCNCGTIFRITPAGEETILYSFGTSANVGTQPSGALIQASDGNFYGTTASGGAANDGTVFKLVVGAN
jgi:uncharacterized repeat protein (TIGR03803 family)